jgi:hypothetical protein
VTHEWSPLAARTNVNFVASEQAEFKKGNDLMERVNTTRVSPTVCCNFGTADAWNLDPHNAGNAPLR